MIKGIIAGLLLIIAPIIGVFLRIQGSNGYVIGTVVTVINLVVILGIGYFLKNDFIPNEEENQEEIVSGKKKSKKKGNKEETEA